MDTIGSKIKVAREEKGWIKKELAKETGFAAGDISDWENGKVAPQIASIEKLALSLRKPTSYFLGANFSSQGDTEHTPDKHPNRGIPYSDKTKVDSEPIQIDDLGGLMQKYMRLMEKYTYLLEENVRLKEDLASKDNPSKKSG